MAGWRQRGVAGVLMDLVFNVLLFIHLVALAVGTATNIVMPLIGRTLAGVPEARPAFGALAKRLGQNSQAALGVLVVTGVAMLGLRYGGLTGASPWLIGKLVLVGALLVLLVVSRVMPPGRIDPKVLGMVMRVALLGIIFCAVMAFN